MTYGKIVGMKRKEATIKTKPLEKSLVTTTILNNVSVASSKSASQTS
jgi:hypothetical protein